MINIKCPKHIDTLIFSVILSLIVLSGTYAKYTSSTAGTATATAADWKISIDGTSSTNYDFVFSAPNTKIYPGITNVLLGNIVIKNESTAVNAEVANITLTPAEGIPDALTLSTDNSDGIIEYGSSKTIPVYISWEYTDTDETSFAGKDFSFTLNLTINQVI